MAHWLLVLSIVQLGLFTLFLAAIWKAIVRAATNMREKFSVKNLIQQVIEAMGEGELQDSLLIGSIHFLLTDENYACKICKQAFKNDQDGV